MILKTYEHGANSKEYMDLADVMSANPLGLAPLALTGLPTVVPALN